MNNNPTKIGIILPHLGASQLSYFVINQINAHIAQSNKFDFVIFYEDLSPVFARPLCATMNMNEIWAFDGLLISTNINNALASLQTVNMSTKVFYPFDLEWMRKTRKDIITNMNIFQNEDMGLVARSSYHAKAIERYSGRKPDIIVPNFHMETIAGKFCGYKTQEKNK